MYLIDIHCHLDFPQFNKDREEVIKRALGAGIGMINVGTGLETSKKSIVLSEEHGNIWASVGRHPTEKENETFFIDGYKKLARHPKVVAIGECGLDLFRRGESDLERQKDIFERQIELSLELDKPLMIHCRQAHKEVLEILKGYKNEKKLRGNVHFFSGNWAEAREYLGLDFSLSFDGPITFSRDYDEIIKNMPFEKLMVETDSPFAAPIPYRGRRNEPLYVEEVAERIAEIREVSFEEVVEQTTKNAIKFFGLK